MTVNCFKNVLKRRFHNIDWRLLKKIVFFVCVKGLVDQPMYNYNIVHVRQC